MAKKYFRVLQGIHEGPGGAIPAEEGQPPNPPPPLYQGGEIVESELDLAAAFVNKFEEVTESEARELTRGKKVKVEKVKEEKKVKEEEPSFGEDVTDQFPGARKGGLLVFHSDAGYVVVDEDEPAKPLSDPIKNLHQARRFVEKNAKA